MTAAPAPRPCGSCPYRRDVPSGVWDPAEYEKLPPYDLETAEQPTAAFFCHQQDGHLCAGWVAVHDMEHSLGLRMAAAVGLLSGEDVESARRYSTDVALFASGAEAAEHGLADIEAPDAAAERTIQKLVSRRSRS